MIFLLGGYDLEMQTIKELLESQNIQYIDKKLSWGAKLSDYSDSLNDENNFYGIELEEDIEVPKKYISIDHHNNNSNKVSSLEQIANILDIVLTRHQMLVALNDSRYIDGMKSICATEDEIKHIRYLDRQAQDITQNDENLADESILKSEKSHIIYSSTEKFTAISDKVYNIFDNYIIYNDFTVSFYGYKISDIISFLEERSIDESKYYYGGGDYGFLGIKKDFLSKSEIKKQIEEFNAMQEKATIISHHTFMFPFIFENKYEKLIIDGWEHQKYENNYNEIAYFHSFFKKSMFTQNESDNFSFYTKSSYKNSEFIICKSKEYKLNLKSVNLRIFSTGVGILSFDVENKNYKEIKDILEINDYGRRIYPEYLDEKLQCSLTPNYIQIKNKDNDINIKENFYFENRPKEIQISQIITSLFPTIYEENKKSDKIRPAIDDRMFVISFYKNSAFSNDLKKDYIKNDRWYEYVFIDGNGKTVQNEEMQTELIKKASYSRWQGYGTMYGISKYSFVCLAENSDFIEKTVEKHMQTMYFQIFSLLLMVRATILKFSSEVSDIAQKIEKKGTSEEVSRLYKRYIQFVNSFYFREITAKDQGLEIYEKALTVLNIERDIKDLDAEIEELHKYVEMQSEKETANNMNILTWIGGVLLPPTIVTSFFGMNYLDGIGEYLPNALLENKGLTSISIVILSGLIIPFYLKIIEGKK